MTNRSGLWTGCAAVVLAVVLGAWARPLVPIAHAQASTRTVWDGIYSEAQATRGETAYKSKCSYCHRDDLQGGFFDDGTGRAPALAGARAFGSSFADRWKQQTVDDLFATIGSTMPQNAPGTLVPQDCIDIVGYLLKMNGVPAGTTELPPVPDELVKIRLVK